MSKIKSLILGSAAVVAASAGAQAADLPVKAKAVQYVKICSLYGAGFYYIPGTDTCIRIGGHIRLDLGFNTANTYDAPAYQAGGTAAQARGRDFYQTRTRIALQTDTRTATEYGVVRTFSDVKYEWANTRDNVAGGFTEVDYGFIQFAGFTFGKAVSNFDAPWLLAAPVINSYTLGASNVSTGVTQIAYTAQFGNGVSGSLALEDNRGYKRSGIYNTGLSLAALGSTQLPNYGTIPNTFTGNAEAGTRVPDIVGNLRLDQAWGSFHVAAAVHEVVPSYYANNGNTALALATAQEANGNPNSKFGYAVSGALELKNLPTGPGDSLKMDVTYAKGAAKYVFGGTFDTLGGGRVASFNSGTFAFGHIFDAVFGSTGTFNSANSQLELSTSYGGRIFFEHYWNPQWRTSAWAGIARQEYNSNATALLLASYGAGGANRTAASGTVNITGGNFNMTLYQVGTTTSWQPVKDLTFSGEFTYGKVDQNLTGTYSTPLGGTQGRSGTFNLGDVNVYSGALRVLRSF